MMKNRFRRKYSLADSERLTCGRGGRTECAWGRRACTTAGDRSKSDIYTKSRTCCWASSLIHSLTTTAVLALILTDSGGHDERGGVAGERGRLQNTVSILYIHGRAQFISVIAPFLLRIISLPDVYITTRGHPCTPRQPLLTIFIYLFSPSSILTKS